jgi:hypothetical protein
LIYSKIERHSIDPRFLAYITENQERVYRYILESLSACYATINDLSICKEVVAKLHCLKIVYSSLNSLSFLIIDDRVFLYYFRGSFITHEQSLFDRELASVEGILESSLFSTKHLSEELQAEIFALSERDDSIHLEVLKQVSREGRITITEV